MNWEIVGLEELQANSTQQQVGLEFINYDLQRERYLSIS